MSGEPFPPLAPTPRCRRKARSTSSDGYGTACVHKYTPDGKLMKPGASPAPIPASSTSCITSQPTPMVLSTSPIAKIIACRCSTGNGTTRPSGQPAPACALCCCRMAQAGEFHHRRARPGMPVNRKVPTLARVSPSFDSKESASRGSGEGTAPASRPASSGAARHRAGLERRKSISAKSAVTTGRPASDRRCRRRLGAAAMPAEAGEV